MSCTRRLVVPLEQYEEDPRGGYLDSYPDQWYYLFLPPPLHVSSFLGGRKFVVFWPIPKANRPKSGIWRFFFTLYFAHLGNTARIPKEYH